MRDDHSHVLTPPPVTGKWSDRNISWLPPTRQETTLEILSFQVDRDRPTYTSSVLLVRSSMDGYMSIATDGSHVFLQEYVNRVYELRRTHSLQDILELVSALSYMDHCWTQFSSMQTWTKSGRTKKKAKNNSTLRTKIECRKTLK